MKHKLIEVIAFGERLIQTQDLDPVYVALVGAKLPKDQMKRLLLAYFCFYHLGVSARLSEATGAHYWELMEIAARNRLCNPDEIDPDLPEGKWPRGTERRHFRGQKCVDAVKAIRRFYGTRSEQPEYFVEFLSGLSFSDLKNIRAAVQQFPMMGPWVAFKVADMLERILGVPIEFPNDLTLFYDEPRAALDMLELPAEKANAHLLKHFSKMPAPPRYERPCNIQELETVACKWKSHVNGHYWIGKDIHEIRNGLAGWGKTADKLLNSMPEEVERGLFA